MITDAALGLLKRGWVPLPIAPASKRPRIKWQRFQAEPPTEGEVKGWFERWPGANLAILTGAISGVVVVDCDSQEAINTLKQRCGGELPVTPRVKTPRGWHLYFRYGGNPVPNKPSLLPGLDLKGDGGYVVAPPSANGEGVHYEWELSPEEADLAPIPDWLLELRHKNEPGDGQVNLQTKSSRILCGVPEGQRDTEATRLAGIYFSRGLDELEVLTLLSHWNQRNGPPLPEDQIRKVVTSVARTDQRNHPERWARPLGLLNTDEFTELCEHEVTISNTDFILRWERYGRSRTDAPAEFHRACAIGLVATAIDRNRWLDLQHKRVYPAINTINLADSGRRKSTPQDYAVEAAVFAFKERLLSNDYSPEALIEDLASHVVARGIAFVDEAGRLLGTMRKNHYGEGLKDLFSKLWDAPEEFSRRLIRGTYQLNSVYVNVVMATTRTRFSETVTSEDITSGFLARFLPVVAAEEIQRRPLSPLTPETEETKRQLAQDLADMRTRLEKKPGPLAIASDVLGRIDQTEQDLEAWAAREFHADLIRPWARRLAEYVSRLAIIYTVSEGREEVGRAQVLRAIQVIDRAKEDVRTLVQDLMTDQQTRDMDKIERFIRANPGISGRELQRRTGMTTGKLRVLATELINQGRIVGKSEGVNRVRYYASDGQPSVCQVSEVSVEKCQ